MDAIILKNGGNILVDSFYDYFTVEGLLLYIAFFLTIYYIAIAQRLDKLERALGSIEDMLIEMTAEGPKTDMDYFFEGYEEYLKQKTTRGSK